MHFSLLWNNMKTEKLGKEKTIFTTSVLDQRSVCFPASRDAVSLPSPNTGAVCCDTSLISEEPTITLCLPVCPSLPLQQKFLHL